MSVIGGIIISFQRARSDAQINSRELNIMNAAKKIMATSSFKDVTFSKIAKLTKLSRPSIYKYYKYPEEILSNILTNEMVGFNDAIKDSEPKNPVDFAHVIVTEILQRDLMMQLMSLNFPIIKYNVRDNIFLALREQIFSFRHIIKTKILTMNPDLSDDRFTIIHYSLLTIMCSSYQLTHDDDYHIELMQKVNPEYVKPSYEKLLKSEILLVFQDLVQTTNDSK